jgi:hypothetical protein
MKKIIFLDIDGVLNVYGSPYCGTRDEFGDCFHKHFVDNLKFVIDNTGAEIVISSTWRMSGLSVMQQMWEMRDLPGKVIDITPDCVQLVDEGISEFYDKVERGNEIQYWLDRNHCDAYVIFDDDNDMLSIQRENFVRTANNKDHPDCVDVGYGLTRICAERAVAILNKTNGT